MVLVMEEAEKKVTVQVVMAMAAAGEALGWQVA